MKKKNLKSLWLNKKSVSSLNMTTIKGGHISDIIGCVSGGDDPVGITDNCVPTTSCPSAGQNYTDCYSVRPNICVGDWD